MTTETQIIIHTKDDSLPAPTKAVVPPAHGIVPAQTRLSDKQRRAIELIIAGAKVSEIAEKAKVDRGTLWRWRTGDPDFIATLNQWRSEMIARVRDRVLSLGEAASDAVHDAIKAGDARISISVMDKLGMLKPGAVSPVDPHGVFGHGVEDEALRGPVVGGFDRVAEFMTDDQQERPAAILALGVIADNTRAGRSSPPGLIAISEEPAPARPVVVGATMVEATASSESHAAGPASSSGESRISAKSVQATVEVRTSVTYRVTSETRFKSCWR